MLQVGVEVGSQNIFETGKPHLKKLVMLTHHLFVFIQHDPGEHSPLAIHTAAYVHVLVLLDAGLTLCYGESIILT